MRVQLPGTTLAPRICTICGKQFLGGPSARFCPECRQEKQKEYARAYKRRKRAGKSIAERDKRLTLDDVLSLTEASEQYGVPKPTLQSACTGQKGYPPLFTDRECRKAGSTWLVTRTAMERVYGKN